MLGIVMSAIAYINPEWLLEAGVIIEGIGLVVFFTIEAALFVMLGAISWNYLSPSNSIMHSPE